MSRSGIFRPFSCFRLYLYSFKWKTPSSIPHLGCCLAALTISVTDTTQQWHVQTSECIHTFMHRWKSHLGYFRPFRSSSSSTEPQHLLFSALKFHFHFHPDAACCWQCEGERRRTCSTVGCESPVSPLFLFISRLPALQACSSLNILSELIGAPLQIIARSCCQKHKRSPCAFVDIDTGERCCGPV